MFEEISPGDPLVKLIGSEEIVLAAFLLFRAFRPGGGRTGKRGIVQPRQDFVDEGSLADA